MQLIIEFKSQSSSFFVAYLSEIRHVWLDSCMYISLANISQPIETFKIVAVLITEYHFF